MSDTPAAPQRAEASLISTLRALWPFFWPSDRPDLQRVIGLSLALILVAKGFTILMPFTFKWATDALVAAAGGKIDASSATTWLIGAPLLASVLYGLVRILMVVFTQLCARGFSRRWRCTRCASSRSAPSRTCTSSRCAFTSRRRPAG